MLSGCRIKGFDAAVDCWGGRVVASGDELTANQPVAPIDYTADLSCPLLGIFGNDDSAPTAEQGDLHEEALKKHGKSYEFHRYDGAATESSITTALRPTARSRQSTAGTRSYAFLEQHLS